MQTFEFNVGVLQRHHKVKLVFLVTQKKGSWYDPLEFVHAGRVTDPR